MTKDLIVYISHEGGVQLRWLNYEHFISNSLYKNNEILFVKKGYQTWIGRLSDHLRSSGPGSRDIIFFTDYLSSSLSVGYSLKDAIGFYLQQCRDIKFAHILCDMLVDLDAGFLFSQAIYKQTVFGEIFFQAIKGAEKTGALVEALEGVKAYLLVKRDFYKLLRKSISYPCFILFIIIVFLFFSATFLFPNLKVLFSQLPSLPMPTQILFFFFNFFNDYISLIFLILLGIFFISFYLSTLLSVREYFSFLLFRIPFISKLYRSFHIFFFLNSFSLLLSHHVPLPIVVQTLSQSESNTAMRKVLEKCLSSLNNGYTMRKVLLDYSFIFSSMILHSLCAAERNGVLREMSKKLTIFTKENLQETMTIFFASLNPVLILLLSFLVFFVLAAVYLPILSLLLMSL